ncbi:TNF receptor-associated factor 5-like [Amblyomma americanum]
MDGCIYTLRDHWQITHDLEIKFLRKLRPELVCSTCDAVTPRGFQDEQSHVYCQKCLQVFTDDKNEFTCQVCDWHGSLKYMKTIDDEWKILEKMKSACPNEKSGCHFSGPFKAVLEHYLSCEVKGKAPCSLCGLVLAIKLLPQHMNDWCPGRILECTFCKSDVVASDKRAHEANCGERPATCEHCEQPIETYNQLEKEHYPICPQMPMSCEFEALGCSYRAPRCDMVKHISQSRHDTLFVQAICELRQENEGLKKLMREKQTSLERNYEEKIKHLESTVAQLQDNASNESSLRAASANSLDQMQHQLQGLKKLMREKQTSLERNYEEKIKHLESTVAQLQDNASNESSLRAASANSLDQMQHQLQALETAQQTYSDLVEVCITETQHAMKHPDRERHLNPEEIKQAVNDAMVPYLTMHYQLKAAHECLKSAYDGLVLRLSSPQQGPQQLHPPYVRPQ